MKYDTKLRYIFTHVNVGEVMFTWRKIKKNYSCPSKIKYPSYFYTYSLMILHCYNNGSRRDYLIWYLCSLLYVGIKTDLLK